MRISLMVAVAENRVIGADNNMPWNIKGEQLLFKAMTFNQWILVGRKTFEAMGKLPDRKYAILSHSKQSFESEDMLSFTSIEQALTELEKRTDHIIIAGGGEIYQELIHRADTLHISVIHKQVEGDILFPEIPDCFKKVFEQKFNSNIDYTYQIWQRCTEAGQTRTFSFIYNCLK